MLRLSATLEVNSYSPPLLKSLIHSEVKKINYKLRTRQPSTTIPGLINEEFGRRRANINYRNCGRRVNPPLHVPPEVRRLKLISWPRAASEIAAEVGQEWRGMIKVSQCHPPPRPNLREGYRQTNQLARETVDRLIARSERESEKWRRKGERRTLRETWNVFLSNSGDRGISILVRDGYRKRCFEKGGAGKKSERLLLLSISSRFALLESRMSVVK